MTSLEALSAFGSEVVVTASQLVGFTSSISADTITFSGGGNADVSGASVNVDFFNLSAAGNVLTVTDRTFGTTTVNGGAGADTVTFLNPGFSSGASTTLDGAGGNDTLTGANGTDFITGGAGADILNGGGGDDFISGDAGNDTLTGGPGADWLLYNDPASGNGSDTITDFSGITAFGGGAGDSDKLTFEGLLHGTFAYRGSQAFLINGNTQARVAAGKVLIDADGNGAADLAITLTGLTSASQLVAGDFQFFAPFS